MPRRWQPEKRLKRAQGELDGLRRSDAVRVRGQDEAAMLAWLARQPDAAAIPGRHRGRAGRTGWAAAMRERPADRRDAFADAAAAFGHRPAAPRAGARQADAQRESGFQQRDEALIEATLRQVQRRYAPAVEKALLADLLRQYQALPAAQHVAEFDAVFGTTPAQIDERLEALYAGTRLGDEATRMALMSADATSLAASTDTLLKAAAQLLPATLQIPLINGHWESSVHCVVVCTLQLP